jgi:hypothetical protein
MTAGPRASASGERHSVARGIEAEGRDATLRLGSREPGAALPHAHLCSVCLWCWLEARIDILKRADQNIVEVGPHL